MIKCYYCKDLKYHTEGFQFEPLVMTESECNPGYFLTTSELEQFAKECFEAAKVVIVRRNSYGPIEYTSPDFATFWAEQKEKLNND